MSERLWPVDAVAGAPRYSGRGLRQLQSPLLAGATTADPLGALSGVRPGTATTTVTATSTTWRCGLHAGVLDVQPAVEAGPYTYAVDAAVTGSMDAADASNPRTDRVYVQLTDQAEGNASSSTPPSVRVLYIAGTARADAPVPALPARAMRLARINVPKQGGGNPTVTWEAPTSVAAGGIIPAASLEELKLLPGWPGAHAAVHSDPNTSLNGDYVWTGTAWAPSSRLLPIGTPLLGTNPPAGTRIIEASGMVLLGTNADGVGALNVPAGTFPNGILNVNADRFDFSNYGPTVHVIHPRGAHTLTDVYLRVYTLAGQPLVNASNIPFSATIRGW